jgi:hypothetical protein
MRQVIFSLPESSDESSGESHFIYYVFLHVFLREKFAYPAPKVASIAHYRNVFLGATESLRKKRCTSTRTRLPIRPRDYSDASPAANLGVFTRNLAVTSVATDALFNVFAYGGRRIYVSRVVPQHQKPDCLQMRRSPYTDIERRGTVLVSLRLGNII